jgi:hypothetical protein
MQPIAQIKKYFVRSALILSVVILAPGIAGCGGSKAHKETSTDGAAGAAVVGELVRVEGVLSLRGSAPHTMLVLEIDEDNVVLIESKTIQAELKSLAGMKVAVEGESMRSIDGETPLINAVRYNMLRLSSGEMPVVGRLSVTKDKCILESSDGKRFWIRGDFVGVIKDFDGAKIWIIGALGDLSLPEKPEGTVPYWVTGYGIISED